MPKIKKGMILCAGLGTRLLPITKKVPKPLVPVLNLANVLHIAKVMQKAGIEEIIVNTFHLAKEVESFLSQKPLRGVNFHFSREEKELLGTGGGVKKAEHFFGKEPFVLSNCDFVTNIDLSPFIETHLQRGAMATMILFEDDLRQTLYSRVGVDAHSNLCSLPKCKTLSPVRGGIFTGLHILSPEIFGYLEEKPSGINDVLYPALMKEHPKKVFGEFANDFYWYDTGDFGSFILATKKLLDQESIAAPQVPTSTKIVPPVLIGEGCKIGDNVQLGPHVVIGKACTIGKNAQISSSVILDGAHVAENAILTDVMHWENQSIPAKILS